MQITGFMKVFIFRNEEIYRLKMRPAMTKVPGLKSIFLYEFF